MTTSRIPALCSALVAQWDTDLPDTVTIYNRRWATPPDGTQSFITVGWTPDFEGANATQQYRGVGGQHRDEGLDIPCYLDVFTGDTDDVQARIDAAYALLAEAENSLRADPTVGGALPGPGWAEVGAYSERFEQTEDGLEVGITFHVIARARI